MKHGNYEKGETRKYWFLTGDIWKRTIVKSKNLKKQSSFGKDKCEQRTMLRRGNLKKSNLRRTFLKKDNLEKDRSGKGQFGKGKSENDNSEQEYSEK